MQLAQTVQAFQHVILWKMSHLAEAAKLHEFIVVFHWTPKSRASKADTAHVTMLLCGVICYPDKHKPLGDAVQFFWQKMLNGTHLEAKAVGLCGARGTMACSGPGDKLQPSNAIDLQLQLLKGCTPRLLPNNNLPFGSGAFRVCRTSQKCQITDVVKHSQNQSYVLGVKLLHLFIWDNCLSQGDQDAVLLKFQLGHTAN